MPAHTPDKPIRKSHATRERILEVARRWFSEQSYENVGVRELALDAGVDAALINRYFGGKKGLFTAVVAGAFDAENHLPSSIDDLGRFLVDQVTNERNQGESPGFNALRLLLLAASSPETVTLVSGQFQNDFVAPLARRLKGRDTQMRAALIAAQVIGLATMRHLLHAPGLQGRPATSMLTLAAAGIQACADPPRRQ